MNIEFLTDGQKRFLLESLTASRANGSITEAENKILEKLEKTVFEERITLTQYKKDGCVKMEYDVTAEVRGNGTVRVETGMSDWGMRFQKLKLGAYGEYLTIMGQRWYINWI